MKIYEQLKWAEVFSQQQCHAEKLSRAPSKKLVKHFRANDEIMENIFRIARKLSKENENAAGSASRSGTPNREPKAKKQVSIDAKETRKEKRGKFLADKKDEKKAFSPKKFSRRSKLKRKRKRHDPLYFGPLIECK